MQTSFEKLGGTYRQVGDYLLSADIVMAPAFVVGIHNLSLFFSVAA